jgi:hypothetical protein
MVRDTMLAVYRVNGNPFMVARLATTAVAAPYVLVATK